MENFATPYPVIFHDGEKDHDKGQVGVHSVLTFKRFQALLSQKVGLTASQISVVFVCRRTGKDGDNKRQKLPINDNTNFNIILNQHNPMWEKDCYFFVSIKKSKKERKGTRRRNVDTDAGEDDDSISPRGDRSPKEERPKQHGVSVGGDETSQEAIGTRESINMHDMPSVASTAESNRSPLDNNPQNVSLANQRLVSASPEAKSGEKILLRRDQKLPGSFTSGWQNKSTLDSPSLENSTPPRVSSLYQADMRLVDQNQSEAIEGREFLRNSMLGKLSNHQNSVVSGNTEGFQERYPDMVANRSALLLQRNGVLNLSGTGMSMPPFAPNQAVRPLMQPPTSGMLLSRVPNGLPSGTAAALQQAQAHYLNLHSQHSEQMQFNSQTLSKMRGVVRNFATCDSGIHRPSGVCRHCYNFRERNINPTPFHLCVHDRITNGFRGPSPAGPIERPSKRVEAAA